MIKSGVFLVRVIIPLLVSYKCGPGVINKSMCGVRRREHTYGEDIGCGAFTDRNETPHKLVQMKSLSTRDKHLFPNKRNNERFSKDFKDPFSNCFAFEEPLLLISSTDFLFEKLMLD